MPIREQTTAPQDRLCIRFYGDDGETAIANLAVDQGQYEVDLTVGAGSDVLYEAGAGGRFDFTSPRTLAFHVDVPSADSVLWLRDVGGANSGVTRVGTTLRVSVDAIAVINLSYTGTELIVVHRTEPNPATTGAGDAYVSTLEIYDVSGATLVRARAAHAVEGGTMANFFVGANSTAGGGSWWTNGGTIRKVRVSSRAVPFTEIAQDWIASLSDITSSAKLVRQGLPLTEASGVGDVGEFHGPAVQLPVAELRHVQWRCMGPLMNWRCINVPDIDDTADTSTTHREKIRIAPGGETGTGFRLRLGWFGVFPVHPLTTAVWCQIHARCFNVTDADLRTFGFRLYSFNKLPIAGNVLQASPGDDPAPLEYHYREITFTSDEAAPGSWRLQAVVPVAVGESGIQRGKTYLGLAYAHDLLDAGTETFRINVSAIHCVQMFDTTAGLPPNGGPAGEAG